MLHSESSSAQSSVNTTTILSNTSNSSPCADSTSSLPATNHAAEDMTQQHHRLTQTETMTNNNNNNGQQHPTATIHTHDINVLEDKKKESKQETSSSTTTSSELGTSLSQDMMSSRVETNHEESTLLPSSSESTTITTTPRESIIQMSSEESQQQQQQQKEGSSSSSQSDIDDDDEDVMEPNNGNDDEDAEEDMSNNASHKYFNIRLPHKNDIHLLSTLRSKVSCSPIYLTQYTALESSAMMMKRRHQRSVSTMRGAVGSHNHPTSNGGGIQLSQSVSLDSLASSQTSSIASSSLGVSSSIPSSSSTHLLNSTTTKTTTPNSGIFLNDMNGTLFQEESALKLFLSNAYNKKHSSSAAISASALFTSSTTEEDTVNILLQAPQPSPSTTTTTAAATTRTTANDATGGSTTHPSKHIGSDSMNGGVSLFTTNTTTGNMNQSGANSPSSVSVENLNNCKIYYFYTPYEKAFMTSTVPPSSSANANIKNNNEPKMAQPSVGSSSSTSAPITTIEKTTTLVEQQQQEHKELSSGHHHHTIAASISETPHSESGSSGATQALIEIGDQIQQQAHHHLNIKEPTAMLSSNLSESTNHTTSMVNPVIINNNGNINPVNTVPASSSCDKASTTHSEQVNHPPHLINVEPPPPPSSSQNTNDSTLSQSRLLLENHTQLSLNLKPSSSATQNQATNPSAQYSTTNPHRRVQSDTAAFQCMQLGSTTTTTTTTDSNGSNDSQDNMSMKTPPSRGKQPIHDLSEQNSFAFSGTNNGNILDQSEGDIRFMLGNEDMTPGGSSAVTSPSSTDSQLGMSLPVNGSNFDVSRAHMKRSGSVRGLNKTVFSPLDKKKSHRRVQSFNVAPITPSLGFSSETEIRAVTIELVLLDIDACFTKFEPLKIISDLWTKDLDYFKFGVKIFNRMYVWLEDSLVHQFTVEKSDLVDCPTIEFVLPEQPVAKIIDATCAIINEFNTKYTYSYYNCHSFSFARKVTEKLSGKKIKSKNVLPKTLVHHFREWREAEKKRKEKEEKEAKEEKEHAKSSSDKSPVTNATSTTAESSDATPPQKDQVTSASSSSGSKEDLNSPKIQPAEKPKNRSLGPLDYLDLVNEEERMRDVNFLYYVPKRLLLKKYRKFHQKQEIKNHTYLLNLINSLLEQCPNFKEEYKMDYYILKTLDRWFWAEKYAQENYDPLKQKSKFFHKEGTKIHFSEPTFLKEIVLDKKNRRRRIFNVKLEDPALDIDFNDPSAVLWKNVDGHLVTNFDHLRQEKKGKTVKVLTMDGGGMKGLILIEILTVIEERVGKKICDIFDIVAGTSTGGICALLINRGIPMKLAKEFYIEIGRTVFDLKTTRNKSFVKTMKVLRGRSWYDGYPLELSSLKLSQDVELNHMHAKKPLTFIVTTMNKSTNPKMNLDEPTACVLRTYSDPYEYGSKNGDSSSKKQPTFYRGTLSGVGITCTDALRATSAAPMYFKARRIGDTECIDGAVVANNPTSIALYETKQIFPNHDKFVFISLGTGALSGKSSQSDTNDGDEEVNLNISPTTKTKKKGISKVFKGISQTINTLLSVVNLQLSSERIHKMASAQLEFFKEGKTLCEYFRLNVPKLGDYGLDEVSDELVSIFEKETKAYIENHPDLDRICELLKQE